MRVRAVVVDFQGTAGKHAEQVVQHFKQLGAEVNEQLFKKRQFSQECGYILAKGAVRILRRWLARDENPLAGQFDVVSQAEIQNANQHLMDSLGHGEATCGCKGRKSCHVCDWRPRTGRNADFIRRNVHDIAGYAIDELIRREFDSADDAGKSLFERSGSVPILISGGRFSAACDAITQSIARASVNGPCGHPIIFLTNSAEITENPFAAGATEIPAVSNGQMNHWFLCAWEVIVDGDPPPTADQLASCSVVHRCRQCATRAAPGGGDEDDGNIIDIETNGEDENDGDDDDDHGEGRIEVVRATPFNGITGVPGDYEWEIKTDYRGASSLYVFNDNAEQHFGSTRGGGNAIARPWNVYGRHKTRSAGICTGHSLGCAYTALDGTAKARIDQDFDEIKQLLATSRYTRVIIPIDEEGNLMTTIFANSIGGDVVAYISEKLRALELQASGGAGGTAAAGDGAGSAGDSDSDGNGDDDDDGSVEAQMVEVLRRECLCLSVSVSSDYSSAGIKRPRANDHKPPAKGLPFHAEVVARALAADGVCEASDDAKAARDDARAEKTMQASERSGLVSECEDA